MKCVVHCIQEQLEGTAICSPFCPYFCSYKQMPLATIPGKSTCVPVHTMDSVSGTAESRVMCPMLHRTVLSPANCTSRVKLIFLFF